MKTTFKTVFNELDDELTDIGIQENSFEDIDVDKIKSEVFMQINGGKSGKKKLSKKVIVILAAAVILIGGTVGAFATGSIQSVFKGYFRSAEVNDLGLYDGGNVETQSDDYNVRLLGVMCDGEIAYSAIEVTKKDGGAVAEDGYSVSSTVQTFGKNSYEFVFDGSDKAQEGGAIPRSRCALSDDRKTLSIYTDYTRGVGAEHELKDFRVTYNSKVIDGYKLDKVLYTEDLPEVQSGSEGLALDDKGDALKKLREDNGVTEDECFWTHQDGKLVYGKGEQKQFDLTFTISFDVNRSVDNKIERELSADNAPNVVKSFTDNAKLTVTPLGISLKGESDQKDDDMQGRERSCFELPGTDGKSKVVMENGTVYYILVNEGGERRTDDDGVYHETTHLQYSPTEGMPYNLGSNRILIDIGKVQSVIINGDTVYEK